MRTLNLTPERASEMLNSGNYIPEIRDALADWLAMHDRLREQKNELAISIWCSDGYCLLCGAHAADGHAADCYHATNPLTRGIGPLDSAGHPIYRAAPAEETTPCHS